MTFRSVMVAVLALFVMAVLVEFWSAVEASQYWISDHAVSVIGVALFVTLSMVSAVVFALRRFRLLTRAEMLCIFYILLIASPVMSLGFWYRYIGMIATVPRGGYFDKIDALPDKLWPHGPNLLEDALEQSSGQASVYQGNVAWDSVEYEEGKSATLPVLSNDEPDDRSSIRVRIPLLKDGRPLLLLETPYLASVLARATGLEIESEYFCRLYYDDRQVFSQEIFSSRQEESPTYLHKKGFIRVGSYGVRFPRTVKEHVDVEFGLEGRGRVELRDPKLMNVAALEDLYPGKRMITESEAQSLPASERAALIVRPDNMFSIAGLKLLLSSYIPVRDWRDPAISWVSFCALVIIAMFAVSVIMRKQWVDNERFQLPLTKIPVALLGGENEDGTVLPPIWKNRIMWMGFAVALFWCMMRAWKAVNPNVPDMRIDIPIGSYLNDPMWGHTWDRVNFKVSAIFLSLAIFLDLNILASLLVGFFLFRLGFWFGTATGLNVYPTFPFGPQQAQGAYLAYAAVILFFARKHLWRVLKSTVTRDRDASDEQAVSYRGTLLLLGATFVGAGVWAKWVGVPFPGLLLTFAIILSIGLVAARLRAECGMMWCWHFPFQNVLVLGLLGGAALVGPRGLMFGVIVFYIMQVAFHMIPGIQFDFIELGHRFKVPRRHVLYASILGLFGGIVIAGWVLLSCCYSEGIETFQNQFFFKSSASFYQSYTDMMAEATNDFLGVTTAPAEQGVKPQNWAYLYGAGGVLVISVLRQLFAGFWLHPIAFVVGTTWSMMTVWGNLLVAFIIRFTVLKLGGAATVREKLFPFFIGVFLGGVATHLIVGCIDAYLYFFHQGAPKLVWPGAIPP